MRGRTAGCIVALAAAVLWSGATGCAGGSGREGVNHFEEERDTARAGYRDGFRSGHDSMFDQDGSWTWLWTMSREYDEAYRRGWDEGRNLRRLRDQAAKERQNAP